MGLPHLAAYEAKLNPYMVTSLPTHNGRQIPFQLAGAPTSGVSGSFVTLAQVGSLLLDTSAGKLYIATVANGSTVTSVSVGSQT